MEWSAAELAQAARTETAIRDAGIIGMTACYRGGGTGSEMSRLRTMEELAHWVKDQEAEWRASTASPATDPHD